LAGACAAAAEADKAKASAAALFISTILDTNFPGARLRKLEGIY
jgi:hypothetical protein